MAYLSLYRKYRPTGFGQMVRQEHVVKVLTNQISSGSVGHAYLFCGPRGTGKTSVARIFARAVNCEHPENGSPCGKCPTCLALSGLDIVEIDAASNNGVAEMRDLREKVQYPPVTGKYKVYIIDEVHMLTDSAFNALLKTLEEPPAHAIFILATTEPHKIPATILSRCMRLDFKLIPEEDLEKHLISILEDIGKPYEREAVSAIARAGAGSDRDMLSIADMCISYSEKLTYEGVTAVLGAADFRETAALCESLLACDLPAVLEKAETILSEGKSVGVLCRDMLEMLNRIAVAKTCRTAEKLLSLPKSHFARVAEIAERAEGRTILRATELLAHTETDLRFVSSPRICLETALMRIACPEADDDIDALVMRIGALEKMLQEGVRPQNAPKPQTAERKPQTAGTKEPPTEIKEPPAEYEFPLEEPIFEEAYFSDGALAEPDVGRPKAKPAQEPAAPKTDIKPAEPVKTPESIKPAAEPRPVRTDASADLIYGRFMRLLRKSCRNGVLFTMCSDLEAVFEGTTLVLFTPSETVLRSLQREEHKRTMAEVFSMLGIEDFAVRLKDAEQEKQQAEDALDELKRNFKDYPIEIK